MKHHHKEVVKAKEVIGRSTADLSPSESKKLAIKKAIAEAVHKVGVGVGVSVGVGIKRRGGRGPWKMWFPEYAVEATSRGSNSRGSGSRARGG